jgi:hypothetical protein
MNIDKFKLALFAFGLITPFIYRVSFANDANCVSQETLDSDALIASGGGALSITSYDPPVLKNNIYGISFEWHFKGDVNHNSRCIVQYKKASDTSEVWKNGHSPFRVDFRGYYNGVYADKYYNMCSGSLVKLDPGTSYDVRLLMYDLDGLSSGLPGEAITQRVKKRFTISTLPIPIIQSEGRIQNTFYVVPYRENAPGGSGNASRPFNGLLEAERASLPPNPVIILKSGYYGNYNFSRPGTQWTSHRLHGAEFNRVNISGDGITLDGLLFTKNSQSQPDRATPNNGFNPNAQLGFAIVASGSSAVITRNSISGYKNGIRVRLNSKQAYIADNVLVGTDAPNNPKHETAGIMLGKSI